MTSGRNTSGGGDRRHRRARAAGRPGSADRPGAGPSVSEPPWGRGHREGPGLALLTLLVQVIGTTVAAHRAGTSVPVPGYLMLIFTALPLADRHVRPRGTLVWVAALTVAYQALSYPAGPTFVALIVADAAVVRAKRFTTMWLVAAASYVAWVPLTEPTMGHAIMVGAVSLGVLLVTGFLAFAAGEIRAMVGEQRRLQGERQRRQASDERLRIAQELHDVLGHHLSLINLRAGVGLHLMDRQPEEARAALETIKDASAEALREVQTVLNTLYPTGETAPRAPAPRLERLDELTENAGLPVHTTITGTVRPLPAEVERAAYRIVQEALTNTRRHATPGNTAAITIDYRGRELLVRVEDDGGPAGTAAAPAVEGNGITGMRERATALGGTFSAGPRPAGGWQVHAILPLPADETDHRVDGEPVDVPDGSPAVGESAGQEETT